MADTYDDDFEEFEEEHPTMTSSTVTGGNVDELREKVKSLEQQLEEKTNELRKLRVKMRRSKPETSSLDRLSVSSTASGHNSALPSPSSLMSRVREIDVSTLNLGEQLAGGGFCTLHKGEWMGMDVAVKRMFDPVITQALKDEFYREVQFLSELRHPNIVCLLGVSSSPPSLCIVTEFMSRGSIYHVLHESEVDVTMARAVRMAKEMTAGVGFMHQLGYLHRDIKSLNFLADDSLRVKLCDFGLAIRMEDMKEDSMSAQGTPNYMAPELFENQCPSRASDVYALGVVFFELVAQEVPFDCLDPATIKTKVLAGERPGFPSKVPRHWRQLIQRCCDPSPSNRPSCVEIRRELDAFRK